LRKRPKSELAELWTLTPKTGYPAFSRNMVWWPPIMPSHRGGRGRARTRVPAMGMDSTDGQGGPGRSEGFSRGRDRAARFGFDLIADFTCEFFTPYAVSFDYGRMRMSVGCDVEG
jgi:hypothetical protein